MCGDTFISACSRLPSFSKESGRINISSNYEICDDATEIYIFHLMGPMLKSMQFAPKYS
jgi:hypothetical protein